MTGNSRRLEAVAIAATILRLPLALMIVLSMRSSIVLSLVLLIALIVADILDGAVARALGVDTDQRRSWDSSVDRIAVHLVLFFAVLWLAPAMFWLYALMVVRDVIGSFVCARAYLRRDRRMMILGDGLHAGWSLGAATFFASMLTAGPTVVFTVGILFLVVSWVLLFDYLGTYVAARKSIVSPEHTGSCRIYSRRLMGLRYILGSHIVVHHESSAIAPAFGGELEIRA